MNIEIYRLGLPDGLHFLRVCVCVCVHACMCVCRDLSPPILNGPLAWTGMVYGRQDAAPPCGHGSDPSSTLIISELI